VRAISGRIVALALCAAQAGIAVAAGRPAEWAEPVALDGVPNLHRVSPTLYRSAQPTAAGMRNLERLGVRTVINLRAFHTDRDEINGTELLNPQLRIYTWSVQDRHVIEVLRILRETEGGPFAIHCQHGADRTGLMTAMYRIVEQGWTKEAAIREMVEGGYGYHAIWRNIVRYVEEADVARIRAAVHAPREDAVTAGRRRGGAAAPR
jgi:protein tyrosine/serine phosphatase